MNKEILMQEIESLVRTIDFIQEEQSFIKHKLSSLLEKRVMENVVAWAEVLHQEIFNRETAIHLLKSDIALMRNQLILIRSANDTLHPQMVLNYKKYKLQVGYLESEFLTWKLVTNENFDNELI
jgi:hypothetical protein